MPTITTTKNIDDLSNDEIKLFSIKIRGYSNENVDKNKMKKHLHNQLTIVQDKLARDYSIYRETNDIEEKLLSLIEKSNKSRHQSKNKNKNKKSDNTNESDSRVHGINSMFSSVSVNNTSYHTNNHSRGRHKRHPKYNDNELSIINQQLNQLIREYVVRKKKKKREEIGANDIVIVHQPIHKMIENVFEKLTTKQQIFYGDIAQRCGTGRTWDAIRQRVKKMVEQKSEKVFYIDSLFIYKARKKRRAVTVTSNNGQAQVINNHENDYQDEADVNCSDVIDESNRPPLKKKRKLGSKCDNSQSGN